MKVSMVWQSSPGDLSFNVVPCGADICCITTPSKALDIPLGCLQTSSVDPASVFAALPGGELFHEIEGLWIGRTGPLGTSIFPESISAGVEVQKCVTESGHVLIVGAEHWGLDLYAPDGTRIVSGQDIKDGQNYFETPTSGLPFWELGASSISASGDSFFVTSPEMGRIDHYLISGELVGVIDKSRFRNTEVYGKEFMPCRVAASPDGNVWVTDGFQVLVFQRNGLNKFYLSEQEFIIRNTMPILSEVFLVDGKQRIWTAIRYPEENGFRCICLSLEDSL